MNWRRLKTPAFLLTLCVLLLASVGMGAAVKYYKLTLVKLPIYPPGGLLLRGIPRETASWIALGPDEQVESEEVLKTLGTTNYLTRAYAKKDKDGKPNKDIQVQLHLAYYTGMIDTVPHVPDRCFVAGGLALADLTKDVPLPLDQKRWTLDPYIEGPWAGKMFKARTSSANYPHLPRDPKNLKLHAMRFLTGGHDLYAGYFFVANGGAVPRAEDVRLLAFDLHATYAYYLKVQFTSASASSEEDLAALSASLLDDLFGDVMSCVPDWVEVEAGNYPEDNPARAKALGAKPAGAAAK